MSNSAIKAFVKYDNSGAIDHKATVEAFQEGLQGYAQQSETDAAAIEVAALSVFAEYPGQRVTGLQDFILRKLETTPTNNSAMKKLVADWVRDNTGRTREEGKLIQTRKGRGQFGSRLWDEVPASEDKTDSEG